METIKNIINTHLIQLWEIIKTHRRYSLISGAVALCVLIWIISTREDDKRKIYYQENPTGLKTSRILSGIGSSSIYEGKERLLTKAASEYKKSQDLLTEKVDSLTKKLEEVELKINKQKETEDQKKTQENTNLTDGGNVKNDAAATSAQPKDTANPERSDPSFYSREFGSRQDAPYTPRIEYSTISRSKGPSVISFPVKEELKETKLEIALPPGSYVKAKLMTGVEAPEGRTYPVLLQLDFAYILPNKKRLDLSGCFMIAKAQGDLSTERVQMQASKLSCVGRDGKMFERDVNGFVADNTDNSFAVIGTVNTKQDRVAAMAFLSSVVQGISAAIQQAQTTQKQNALGGSETEVSGDNKKYILAGGAGNAANLVAQWYLKQAQNLLPTINVGSGQDVWIVMNESVGLPNSFFKKTTSGDKKNENPYSFITRIID